MDFDLQKASKRSNAAFTYGSSSLDPTELVVVESIVLAVGIWVDLLNLMLCAVEDLRMEADVAGLGVLGVAGLKNVKIYKLISVFVNALKRPKIS